MSDKPKLTFESSSWYAVYTQPEDTAGRPDHNVQEIELEAVDALSNDHYLVIKTDRWAIDINEIDEFCQLLKDFVAKNK